MKCVLHRVDNGVRFVEDAIPQKNADGSTSFLLTNGKWAGQEPMQYGVRHDQPGNETPGVYQRATVKGNTAVFVTRPQDPPMAYFYAEGQAY
jgi:hypothetical protein